jgi:hypothetical protein
MQPGFNMQNDHILAQQPTPFTTDGTPFATDGCALTSQVYCNNAEQFCYQHGQENPQQTHLYGPQKQLHDLFLWISSC